MTITAKKTYIVVAIHKTLPFGDNDRYLYLERDTLAEAEADALILSKDYIVEVLKPQ